MIGIGAVRYYLYDAPADMRKSYAGLAGLVHNELDKNLLEGEGFIFMNKRKNMVKILWWDGTGFVLHGKKLAKGTFELPKIESKMKRIEVSPTTLRMMLEGVSLKGIKMRKCFNIRERQSRA
ncbi:MAG: IS66 family insertion sequence element accessory protein TnpB [Cyclobacteriaceae bacterium]